MENLEENKTGQETRNAEQLETYEERLKDTKLVYNAFAAAYRKAITELEKTR